MKTRRLGPDDIEEAADILRGGGIVAVPTETVYGLAGDASNADAVDAIFEAKGRPAGHPLIVHVSDLAAAEHWAGDLDPRAESLAEEFWPGPLTLIVDRSDRAVEAVTGGRDTIGLRVPDHPLTLQLLKRFGGGLAAPSANRFGHISPTTAAHVLDDLDGRIDAVLDGGPSSVGLESTIIELVGGPPTLLRPGGITVAEIENHLGEIVLDGVRGTSRASGMMASHYAPTSPTRMVDQEEAIARLATDGSVVVIGPLEDQEPDPRWIELAADSQAFARGLYWAMRNADEMLPTEILIVPPRIGRLVAAIRDRLEKASA